MSKETGTTTEQAAAKPAVEKMPEQNGIRQPKPGTNCAHIWDLATAMSTERKATVAVGDLLVKAREAGYNDATVKTQYARWRKFHGVEGRIESDKAREARAAKEAEKAKKAEERAAKKAEREAEKERKAQEKAEAKAKREAEKQAKAEAKAKEAAEKEAAKANSGE